MAKLKGIYRFKDVLSLPTNSKIRQNINFSVYTEPNLSGFEFLFLWGSAIEFNNGDVDYHVEYTSPDTKGILALEFPATFNVYFGEWDTDSLGNFGEGIKTVTIPYEQEVSDEFHEAFTANTEYIGEADTADATIFYGGKTVTTLNGGEYVTIHTKGQKMEDDLRVEVARASGGDSDKPPEIATEAEMTALLDTAEVGSVYKYADDAEESGTYENGVLYIIEE